MIRPLPENKTVSSPEGAPKLRSESKRSTTWDRISFVVQLILTLGIAGGVLAYLLWSGTSSPSQEDEKRPTRPEEVVQVAGPLSIRVRPGTPLDSKLQVASVEAAWL